MQKKISVIAVAFVIGIFVQPAYAQQAKKVHRIGTLFPGTPDSSGFLSWFRDGMAKLGYAEGQNYVLVSHWAMGKRKHLPLLAQKLVREKVEVILVRGSLQIRALKKSHQDNSDYRWLVWSFGQIRFELVEAGRKHYGANVQFWRFVHKAAQFAYGRHAPYTARRLSVLFAEQENEQPPSEGHEPNPDCWKSVGC